MAAGFGVPGMSVVGIAMGAKMANKTNFQATARSFQSAFSTTNKNSSKLNQNDVDNFKKELSSSISDLETSIKEMKQKLDILQTEQENLRNEKPDTDERRNEIKSKLEKLETSIGEVQSPLFRSTRSLDNKQKTLKKADILAGNTKVYNKEINNLKENINKSVQDANASLQSLRDFKQTVVSQYSEDSETIKQHLNKIDNCISLVESSLKKSQSLIDKPGLAILSAHANTGKEEHLGDLDILNAIISPFKGNPDAIGDMIEDFHQNIMLELTKEKELNLGTKDKDKEHNIEQFSKISEPHAEKLNLAFTELCRARTSRATNGGAYLKIATDFKALLEKPELEYKPHLTENVDLSKIRQT